jgi:EF hand
MRKNIRWFALALALGLPTITAMAQDSNPPSRNPDRRPNTESGGPQGERPPGEGMRRPQSPLFAALDSNHDGIIDEQEIAQAAESLKKLDKNGDGKITMDEIRPAPPQGQDGFSRGPGEGQGRRGPRPDGDGPQDRPDRPARPQPPGGGQ